MIAKKNEVKLRLRVNLVVCKVNLGRRVDIKKMGRWLTKSKKSTSRKLIAKLGGGRRLWLFDTGSGVLSGFKNMDEVKEAVERLAEYLRIKKDKIKVAVANIQASGGIGCGIDLYLLAQRIIEAGGTVQYILGVGGFPNMFYHLKNAKGTAIISARGNISVVGIKSFSDIPKIRKELEQLLNSNKDCLQPL